MNDQNAKIADNFEQFMSKVLARPIPNMPMEKVRVFAKELAEGSADGCWPYIFPAISLSFGSPYYENMKQYEIVSHLWIFNSQLKQYAPHIADLLIDKLRLN